MRDINEVLQEKENRLEEIRREIWALQLTAQLVEEPEALPSFGAAREESNSETDNAEVDEATTVSTRLRRIAAPLFSTFGR